ncbi:hypothetical protein SprV_0902792300 [Sparganum proliferum]
MDNAPSPSKWRLTGDILSVPPKSVVHKHLRVVLILLHICLMLEAVFLLALGHNAQYGADTDFLRQFIGVFLPTAPKISKELAVGILVVSAPAILAVGVLLILFFLCGVIVSCFGYEKPQKIYAVLLGVLVIGLVIATASVFGSPTCLPDKAVSYMSENLAVHKNGHHGKNLPAVEIWNTVMREGHYYCCGLNGYKDFAGSRRMPEPCCSVDNQVVTESCTYKFAAEMKPPVPGCRDKIIFEAELSRPRLAIAPVSVLIPPVIVLVAVICSVFA